MAALSIFRYAYIMRSREENEKPVVGKTAVVTGASSGIGRETAASFARAGANVVLASRRPEALQTLLSALPAKPNRLLAIPTDISRDSDVARLVEGALEKFQRIDILVNNAGIGLNAPLADPTPKIFIESWR